MKILTIAVLLLAVACGPSSAFGTFSPRGGEKGAHGAIEVVAASPADGFNFPYVLRLPAAPVKDRTYLLVEPNNTGRISDDLNVHLEGAKDAASTRKRGGGCRSSTTWARRTTTTP